MDIAALFCEKEHTMNAEDYGYADFPRIDACPDCGAEQRLKAFNGGYQLHHVCANGKLHWASEFKHTYTLGTNDKAIELQIGRSTPMLVKHLKLADLKAQAQEWMYYKFVEVADVLDFCADPLAGEGYRLTVEHRFVECSEIRCPNHSDLVDKKGGERPIAAGMIQRLRDGWKLTERWSGTLNLQCDDAGIERLRAALGEPLVTRE